MEKNYGATSFGYEVNYTTFANEYSGNSAKVIQANYHMRQSTSFYAYSGSYQPSSEDSYYVALFKVRRKEVVS